MKRHSLSWLRLLSLTVVALGLVAHERSAIAGSPLVGEWPGYDRAFEEGLAVRGNYAYLSGMKHIFDVTNPANPLRVGGVQSSGFATVFVGSLAYVATGGGLAIYDLANPVAPTLLGSIDTTDFAAAVAVSGNYAFVADYSGGLRVIDISNPTNPTAVTALASIALAIDVKIAGNYAYVVDEEAGLRIVDISNPAAPALVGTFQTSGFAYRVAIAGNFAYVACEDEDTNRGLQIVNVSNPAAPTLAGFFDAVDFLSDVTIVGNFAYVAGGSGFRILDITNPANPIPTAPAAFGNFRRIAVAGDHANLVQEGFGLRVFNVANPATLLPAGSFSLAGFSEAVAIAGDYAYLAEGRALQIVSITNPAAPTAVGQLTSVGIALGVTVSGNYAYMAYQTFGMRIVSVTNPANPVLVSTLPTFNARAIAVVGNLAYIADGEAGLRIANIANRSSPILVGTYNTPGAAYGVAVESNRAYVADVGRGLQVIDVSVPNNPTLLGNFQTLGAANDVVVSGTNAYVANGIHGIEVIDVSNPAAMRLIARVDTAGFAVGVAAGSAYIADSAGGVEAFDFNASGAFVSTGQFPTQVDARDVAASGNYVFAACATRGLVILNKAELGGGGGPLPELSITNSQVVEGNSGTAIMSFNVSLSATSAQPVTVTFASSNGTGTAGVDYTAASGTLTFNPGDPLVKQIQVQVAGDTLEEPDETFSVILTNATGATIAAGTATGTIINDDVTLPSMSISGVTVAEGDAGTTNASFAVLLSQASASPVTVGFATVDGTATGPADYAPTNGTLTFAPGETVKSIIVEVRGDMVDEDDESFSVQLVNPSNATITVTNGVGVITDDDSAPALSIGDDTVIEGNEGTTNAVFTVALSNPSSRTVTVDYASADGTAISGADYVAVSGSLTFAPGETNKTIVAPVSGDALDEEDESFSVQLLNATNAVVGVVGGVGVIIDDDGTPVLSIADATVFEGNEGVTNLVLTVILSGASSRTVTVDYASANGTAIASADYIAVSGSLTFAPGATSKTIIVPVSGDTVDEEDETFAVTLANATNAVIADAAATGTIVDDDLPPSLSIGDVTVVEGNEGATNVAFRITLSAASEKVVTVNLATANGTAIAPGDYATTTAMLTFAPGETSKSVLVPVNGDVADEEDETFNVALTAPVNATITRAQGVGAIIDDDSPLVLGAAITAPGRLTISWPISTRIYVLEVSSNLVTWQVVTDVITEGNQYKALINTTANRAYYRVAEQ